MKKILVCLCVLLIAGICHADDFFGKIKGLNDRLGENLQEKEKTTQLYEKKIKETIEEKKKEELAYDKKRARLLYQKALLIFKTFKKPLLKTPTTCLLEAIRLDPDNEKYTEYLCGEIYRKHWMRRERHGNEKLLEELDALEQEVKRVYREYQR